MARSTDGLSAPQQDELRRQKSDHLLQQCRRRFGGKRNPLHLRVFVTAMVLVASYNIRKAIAADRRRRPERILEVLAEIKADIVLLQEADRRFGARQSAIPFSMLAEHSAYRPVPFDMRHGSMGWHGNAILVGPGVEIVRHQPLHLPALEPRGAVMADVRVKGKALRLVGMHLDLSGLWRRRQARAILTELGQQADMLPTLLGGDLNEWGLGGCLRDFGLHFHALPLGPSFHARGPVGKLDRMFVSDGIAVETCGVHRSLLARNASDHLPVWARIRLS
jgi:endonuclease/exonuclease/phosphatase family metal-dependent hydrolase